jgi:hypothetical protein
MTSNIDEFDFTGSVGADVAKEANKGGDFEREIEFLTLKADPASIQQGKDKAFIRLATEYERKPWMGNVMTPWSLPWITVKQHYAPTRTKPEWAKKEQAWPEKMFAVCRKDKVFAAKFGGACINCERGNKATDRSWALAIEREQVFDDNGRPIGMRDKMRSVFARDEKGEAIVIGEKDGKKEYQMTESPAWLLLNFGWKNFFNALSGQAQYFGTILGRDYVVQRSGMGNNDTNYTFIGLDPIKITGEWAASLGVPEGTDYDLGLPLMETEDGKGGLRQIPLSEALYPTMPDLRKIIADRTADDYYGRWFVEGWNPEGYVPGQNAQQGVQGVQGGGYVPPQQPSQPITPQPQQNASTGAGAPAGGAPAGGPTPSVLESLRNRVSGGQAAQQ